ncbi:ArsR/SmtB family transcription factor [Desulfovirgula thermocuniculi]|uniref:ArsR/SmtB family transcription factor n=1 Tax=Desulfovirgula thermocuniculi TaxID=348842 RepID=UPI000414F802|nr:metalloregulator ArsR/SmtB family transcription factor [Desulfovirgula thermocuniculi]
MNKHIPRLKADILKALAHPTRVSILECLRQGERCVCEIIEELDMEQSNISQHLAILKKMDIVDSRKEGLRVNYWVKYPEVFQILDLLDNVLIAQVQDTMSTLKGLTAKQP